jgi:diacylglycerol kinase (ATP)
MRLLRLFPSIYSGQHVNYPEVMTRQVREIRIEAPQGLVLAPDGELYGKSPATITCLPRDLEIFC